MSESTRIRTAVIDDSEIVEVVAPPCPNTDDDKTDLPKGTTIEEALYNRLANFLDKRKASGDARPCGPHGMVPVYGSIFVILKEKLEDERFLARFTRSGLENIRSKQETAAKGRARKYAEGQEKG